MSENQRKKKKKTGVDKKSGLFHSWTKIQIRVEGGLQTRNSPVSSDYSSCTCAVNNFHINFNKNLASTWRQPLCQEQPPRFYVYCLIGQIMKESWLGSRRFGPEMGCLHQLRVIRGRKKEPFNNPAQSGIDRRPGGSLARASLLGSLLGVIYNWFPGKP